jgi:hypothetical protein
MSTESLPQIDPRTLDRFYNDFEVEKHKVNKAKEVGVVEIEKIADNYEIVILRNNFSKLDNVRVRPKKVGGWTKFLDRILGRKPREPSEKEINVIFNRISEAIAESSEKSTTKPLEKKPSVQARAEKLEVISRILKFKFPNLAKTVEAEKALAQKVEPLRQGAAAPVTALVAETQAAAAKAKEEAQAAAPEQTSEATKSSPQPQPPITGEPFLPNPPELKDFDVSESKGRDSFRSPQQQQMEPLSPKKEPSSILQPSSTQQSEALLPSQDELLGNIVGGPQSGEVKSPSNLPSVPAPAAPETSLEDPSVAAAAVAQAQAEKAKEEATRVATEKGEPSTPPLPQSKAPSPPLDEPEMKSPPTSSGTGIQPKVKEAEVKMILGNLPVAAEAEVQAPAKPAPEPNLAPAAPKQSLEETKSPPPPPPPPPPPSDLPTTTRKPLKSVPMQKAGGTQDSILEEMIEVQKRKKAKEEGQKVELSPTGQWMKLHQEEVKKRIASSDLPDAVKKEGLDKILSFVASNTGWSLRFKADFFAQAETKKLFCAFLNLDPIMLECFIQAKNDPKRISASYFKDVFDRLNKASSEKESTERLQQLDVLLKFFTDSQGCSENIRYIGEKLALSNRLKRALSVGLLTLHGEPLSIEGKAIERPSDYSPLSTISLPEDKLEGFPEVQIVLDGAKKKYQSLCGMLVVEITDVVQFFEDIKVVCEKLKELEIFKKELAENMGVKDLLPLYTVGSLPLFKKKVSLRAEPIDVLKTTILNLTEGIQKQLRLEKEYLFLMNVGDINAQVFAGLLKEIAKLKENVSADKILFEKFESSVSLLCKSLLLARAISSYLFDKVPKEFDSVDVEKYFRILEILATNSNILEFSRNRGRNDRELEEVRKTKEFSDAVSKEQSAKPLELVAQYRNLLLGIKDLDRSYENVFEPLVFCLKKMKEDVEAGTMPFSTFEKMVPLYSLAVDKVGIILKDEAHKHAIFQKLKELGQILDIEDYIVLLTALSVDYSTTNANAAYRIYKEKKGAIEVRSSGEKPELLTVAKALAGGKGVPSNSVDFPKGRITIPKEPVPLKSFYEQYNYLLVFAEKPEIDKELFKPLIDSLQIMLSRIQEKKLTCLEVAQLVPKYYEAFELAKKIDLSDSSLRDRFPESFVTIDAYTAILKSLIKNSEFIKTLVVVDLKTKELQRKMERGSVDITSVQRPPEDLLSAVRSGKSLRKTKKEDKRNQSLAGGLSDRITTREDLEEQEDMGPDPFESESAINELEEKIVNPACEKIEGGGIDEKRKNLFSALNKVEELKETAETKGWDVGDKKAIAILRERVQRAIAVLPTLAKQSVGQSASLASDTSGNPPTTSVKALPVSKDVKIDVSLGQKQESSAVLAAGWLAPVPSEQEVSLKPKEPVTPAPKPPATASSPIPVRTSSTARSFPFPSLSTVAVPPPPPESAPLPPMTAVPHSLLRTAPAPISPSKLIEVVPSPQLIQAEAKAAEEEKRAEAEALKKLEIEVQQLITAAAEKVAAIEGKVSAQVKTVAETDEKTAAMEVEVDGLETKLKSISVPIDLVGKVAEVASNTAGVKGKADAVVAEARRVLDEAKNLESEVTETTRIAKNAVTKATEAKTSLKDSPVAEAVATRAESALKQIAEVIVSAQDSVQKALMVQKRCEGAVQRANVAKEEAREREEERVEAEARKRAAEEFEQRAAQEAKEALEKQVHEVQEAVRIVEPQVTAAKRTVGDIVDEVEKRSTEAETKILQANTLKKDVETAEEIVPEEKLADTLRRMSAVVKRAGCELMAVLEFEKVAKRTLDTVNAESANVKSKIQLLEEQLKKVLGSLDEAKGSTAVVSNEGIQAAKEAVNKVVEEIHITQQLIEKGVMDATAVMQKATAARELIEDAENRAMNRSVDLLIQNATSRIKLLSTALTAAREAQTIADTNKAAAQKTTGVASGPKEVKGAWETATALAQEAQRLADTAAARIEATIKICSLTETGAKKLSETTSAMVEREEVKGDASKKVEARRHAEEIVEKVKKMLSDVRDMRAAVQNVQQAAKKGVEEVAAGTEAAAREVAEAAAREEAKAKEVVEAAVGEETLVETAAEAVAQPSPSPDVEGIDEPAHRSFYDYSPEERLLAKADVSQKFTGTITEYSDGDSFDPIKSPYVIEKKIEVTKHGAVLLKITDPIRLLFIVDILHSKRPKTFNTEAWTSELAKKFREGLSNTLSAQYSLYENVKKYLETYKSDSKTGVFYKMILEKMNEPKKISGSAKPKKKGSVQKRVTLFEKR